jgi:nitrite reductase/ring-hydroxylating ferredoxin subunit
MPVVVARAADGSIAAFENRCAHRGTLICLDNAGSGAKIFNASTKPGAMTCAATFAPSRFSAV